LVALQPRPSSDHRDRYERPRLHRGRRVQGPAGGVGGDRMVARTPVSPSSWDRPSRGSRPRFRPRRPDVPGGASIPATRAADDCCKSPGQNSVPAVLVCKQGVVGSSPIVSTRKSRSPPCGRSLASGGPAGVATTCPPGTVGDASSWAREGTGDSSRKRSRYRPTLAAPAPGSAMPSTLVARRRDGVVMPRRR
jgi:hypothetical protein